MTPKERAEAIREGKEFHRDACDALMLALGHGSSADVSRIRGGLAEVRERLALLEEADALDRELRPELYTKPDLKIGDRVRIRPECFCSSAPDVGSGVVEEIRDGGRILVDRSAEGYGWQDIYIDRLVKTP